MVWMIVMRMKKERKTDKMMMMMMMMMEEEIDRVRRSAIIEKHLSRALSCITMVA